MSSIEFSIGGDNNAFVAAMKSTEKIGAQSAERIRKSLADVGEVKEPGTAKLARLAAGAAVAAGGVNVLTQALDKFGNVQDLSDRTGLSVEFLQQIEKSAAASGSSVDAVAKAVSKFAKELLSGGAASQEALAQIGLSVERLDGLRPDQIFAKIAAAVSGIKDPMARSAAAQQLFGKSGAELIPILGQVNAAMADTDVLSAKQVKSVDDLGDAWTSLGGEVKNTAGTMLALISAVVTPLINVLRSLLLTVRQMYTAMAELGTAGSKAFDFVKKGDFSGAVESLRQSALDRSKERMDRYCNGLQNIWGEQEEGGEETVVANSGEGAGGTFDAGNISAGKTSGASRGKADRFDPSKTPEERRYEDYMDNDAFDGNGAAVNPGRLRSLQRAAARARERADRRATRGIGNMGFDVENPDSAASRQANNLGRFGALGGTGAAEGLAAKMFGRSPGDLSDPLGRAAKQTQKAQDDAKPEGATGSGGGSAGGGNSGRDPVLAELKGINATLKSWDRR